MIKTIDKWYHAPTIPRRADNLEQPRTADLRGVVSGTGRYGAW